MRRAQTEFDKLADMGYDVVLKAYKWNKAADRFVFYRKWIVREEHLKKMMKKNGLAH